MQKLMAPGTAFSIDETAMKSYRDLVNELHALNIRIVYVIPPLSQSVFSLKPIAFANYTRAALANKLEQDQVIDFTSDEFADFRRNGGNFKDGVHLTNEAAQRVVAAINARLK
jgi:lysophospholipase L1-like esterase